MEVYHNFTVCKQRSDQKNAWQLAIFNHHTLYPSLSIKFTMAYIYCYAQSHRSVCVRYQHA